MLQLCFVYSHSNPVAVHAPLQATTAPAECYVCSVVHLTFTGTCLYLMLQCEDTLCHEDLYCVQQLNASSYSKVKLQLSSECYFCHVVHVIFTVFPLYLTLQ